MPLCTCIVLLQAWTAARTKQVFQVNHISWVPNTIPLSAAESESSNNNSTKMLDFVKHVQDVYSDNPRGIQGTRYLWASHQEESWNCVKLITKRKWREKSATRATRNGRIVRKISMQQHWKIKPSGLLEVVVLVIDDTPPRMAVND